MPVKPDREYRNMILEIKSESDDMMVEGYASTFNQPYILCDYDNFRIREQVDPHAFDETDMSDVIMQYDHEGRVFARKSNNTLTVMPDDHGLLINARLGGTTIGRQLYEEIKGGYTNKMSFGFTVTGETWEDSKGDDGVVESLRTITRVGKLYDVSAVSLPCNDMTSISARSVSDGAIERIKAERLAAEKRMKVELLKDRIRKIQEASK